MMMKKLLSLPPNLVKPGEKGPTVFHDITQLPVDEFFCTCDPEGHRVGSGGGTAWLLWQAFSQSSRLSSFSEWLASEKRILLHAGGQSRRLPAYAPSGKILTPIPVFRWERGQRLGQDLLSLQLPLYERSCRRCRRPTWCAMGCGSTLPWPAITACSWPTGSRRRC